MKERSKYSQHANRLKGKAQADFKASELPHIDSALEFAKLYRIHFPRVKAFLMRIGCPYGATDDLAQETFCRAWTGRKSYVGRAAVQTWLFAIAYNVARESLRRKVMVTLLEQDLVPNHKIDPIMADKEQSQAVRDAVEQLPPKQQQAVQLVYFDELVRAQAAISANCTDQVLRRRLAEARSNLRRRLDGHQAD